ncbi:hypothetical protein BDV93DRAFT_517967 [Ceratobasidium sp. AG-I]|nr:hypothetical protein BDV93DRAFT_517967 [Ceratobasidium sp. AG-I]
MTKRKAPQKQQNEPRIVEVDDLGIPLVRASEQERIDEDEQWRLINDTGILQNFSGQKEEEEEELTPLAGSILDTAIIAIPLCFLYVLLDILVQQQYSQQPTISEELGRVISNVPILAILIHYTNKHKSRPFVQMLLFLAAIMSGPRLIWLVNNGSWLVVTRQAPPIGTIWIYTIVQLNLIPAVTSLGLVLGCAKLMNWKLVF